VLILFGFKRYVEVLGVVTLICRHCSQPAAQRIEEWTTKFTVFFVPLFTTRRRQVMQCASCAAQSELSREEAERLLVGPASDRNAG
jgi:zinc-ribbon family